MSLEAVFYTSAAGAEPVLDLLETWRFDDPRGHAKVVLTLDRLAATENGVLPFPFTGHVRDGLRELRVRFSARNYRLLYFVARNQIVIVHGLLKKADQLPGRDVRLSASRMAEWKARTENP